MILAKKKNIEFAFYIGRKYILRFGCSIMSNMTAVSEPVSNPYYVIGKLSKQERVYQVKILFFKMSY